MKKDSPAKKSLGQRIRELRQRTGRNQAEFAEFMGVSQPVVSSWEKDRAVPTGEALVKLGNMASYPASFEFWEAAGIERRKVTAAVDAYLSNRPSPSTDAVVQIPILADRGDGTVPSATESFITLPAVSVPHPASTFCLRMGTDIFAPVVAKGELIVIDGSVAGLPDVGERMLAAVYVAPEEIAQDDDLAPQRIRKLAKDAGISVRDVMKRLGLRRTKSGVFAFGTQEHLDAHLNVSDFRKASQDRANRELIQIDDEWLKRAVSIHEDLLLGRWPHLRGGLYVGWLVREQSTKTLATMVELKVGLVEDVSRLAQHTVGITTFAEEPQLRPGVHILGAVIARFSPPSSRPATKADKRREER